MITTTYVEDDEFEANVEDYDVIIGVRLLWEPAKINFCGREMDVKGAERYIAVFQEAIRVAREMNEKAGY